MPHPHTAALAQAVDALNTPDGPESPDAPGSTVPPKDPAAGSVVFDGQDLPGGGELILVSPPARLEPLWTVEGYKRRR